MACPLEIKCSQCYSNNRCLIAPLTEEGRLVLEVLRENNAAQKPYCYTSRFHRLFCYGTGALGASVFAVSCIASTLIPAIGSIGIIIFAVVLRNKSIVQIKDPTPEVIVVNQAFEDRLKDFFMSVGNDDFSDDDFSDDNGVTELAQSGANDVVCEEGAFLEKFQAYIMYNNTLNCHSLRGALCQEDYQELFQPKQLLEEILHAYQSIKNIDVIGIKLDRKDLSKYIQGKIEKIEQKLTESIYLEEPDQEQKEFIEIIHKQAEQERLRGAEDSDKVQLLVKKMTLIGSFYEVLAHYRKLEDKEKKYFSEKATHAYDYVKQLKDQYPILTPSLAEKLRQGLDQRSQDST